MSPPSGSLAPESVAVSTTVAAWAARGQGARTLAITDLFHGEVFGCVHDTDGRLISKHESGDLGVVLASLGEHLTGGVIAAGSAILRHRAAIENALPGARFLELPGGLASHLASLASESATPNTTSKASDLLPFYLRDPLTRGLLHTQPRAK